MIDFFLDGAPELTDTNELWTDYYDNLESADIVEDTPDVIDASEPPDEDVDGGNIFEGEDGPTEENDEEEDLDGENILDGTGDDSKLKTLQALFSIIILRNRLLLSTTEGHTLY